MIGNDWDAIDKDGQLEKAGTSDYLDFASYAAELGEALVVERLEADPERFNNQAGGGFPEDLTQVKLIDEDQDN